MTQKFDQTHSYRLGLGPPNDTENAPRTRAFFSAHRFNFKHYLKVNVVRCDYPAQIVQTLRPDRETIEYRIFAHSTTICQFVEYFPNEFVCNISIHFVWCVCSLLLCIYRLVCALVSCFYSFFFFLLLFSIKR